MTNSNNLTERENLACRLAGHVRLLESIDAQREACGVPSWQGQVESAIVGEALGAVAQDTAKDEAAHGMTQVIVLGPDWCERFFARRAA